MSSNFWKICLKSCHNIIDGVWFGILLSISFKSHLIRSFIVYKFESPKLSIISLPTSAMAPANPTIVCTKQLARNPLSVSGSMKGRMTPVGFEYCFL